ncbi:MAG TPA: hypothetical protein VMT00_13180 [Thermoanaerobaculia bacterium]|nr:hypothetical protein [Thermoanaerobaculia bacterium]
MKHGKKNKKSAKAPKARTEKSKPKGKAAKISPKSSAKASSKEKRGGKKVVAEKGGRRKESRTSPKRKTAGRNNGKAEGKAADFISFSNPLVAAAFKRAVKKYSVALKRLTD